MEVKRVWRGDGDEGRKDLPLSVLHAIYVIDCDWCRQCKHSCSKGLPDFFIHEVLACSTVQECMFLCDLLHCQEFEVSVNCFGLPGICHVYFCSSEISCFFSMI